MSRHPAVAMLVSLWVLFASALVHAQPAVAVEGLMPGAAVLSINGQRKLMKVGHSHEGVSLLEVGDEAVVLEIDGARQVLGLSRRIGSSYAARERQVVTIARNTRNQYKTTALINGRSTLVLVDTGATIVALSSLHARQMGINYRLGTPSKVQTASGLVDAYSLTLESVSVGGIRVENVAASVVDGDYPVTVLLGMSFLNHVRIEEGEGVLSLSKGP